MGRAMVLLLLLGTGAAHAAPAFTCEARGDGWTIQGSATRRMSCQFTCALKGQGDLADHVTCAAVVGPGVTGPVCEGYQSQRHWTGAELVAETCAVAP